MAVNCCCHPALTFPSGDGLPGEVSVRGDSSQSGERIPEQGPRDTQGECSMVWPAANLLLGPIHGANAAEDGRCAAPGASSQSYDIHLRASWSLVLCCSVSADMHAPSSHSCGDSDVNCYGNAVLPSPPYIASLRRPESFCTVARSSDSELCCSFCNLDHQKLGASPRRVSPASMSAGASRSCSSPGLDVDSGLVLTWRCSTYTDWMAGIQ
jgi:hypothetical protein